MIQESFGEISPSLQAVQLQIASINESVKRVGHDRALAESLDGTREAESSPKHQAEIAIQTSFQAPAMPNLNHTYDFGLAVSLR